MLNDNEMERPVDKAGFVKIGHTKIHESEIEAYYAKFKTGVIVERYERVKKDE